MPWISLDHSSSSMKMLVLFAKMRTFQQISFLAVFVPKPTILPVYLLARSSQPHDGMRDFFLSLLCEIFAVFYCMTWRFLYCHVRVKKSERFFVSFYAIFHQIPKSILFVKSTDTIQRVSMNFVSALWQIILGVVPLTNVKCVVLQRVHLEENFIVVLDAPVHFVSTFLQSNISEKSFLPITWWILLF